jgi:hypothetical protein
MYDTELTVDERRCLRMWFRQAIAHVEMEEAKQAIMAEHAITHNSHSRYTARRTRRSRLTSLSKQLA